MVVQACGECVYGRVIKSGGMGRLLLPGSHQQLLPRTLFDAAMHHLLLTASDLPLPLLCAAAQGDPYPTYPPSHSPPPPATHLRLGMLAVGVETDTARSAPGSAVWVA